MTLDVSKFHKLAVVDTCAVWNVLSSQALHYSGVAAGCHFSLTEFVLYECLHKPRSVPKPTDTKLQERLRQARVAGQFKSFPLALEDLQDLDVLEQRRRLSKGELAAIVFARKTRQAFLTDDQGARKLAAMIMERTLVQTTPQLLGWLVFTGRLGDSDISGIIAEHEELGGTLRPFLIRMYEEAMRCRLLVHQTSK